MSVSYIIGDVGSIRLHRQSLARLFKHLDLKAPRILYLGAAFHNDNDLMRNFTNGAKSRTPQAQVEPLALSLESDTDSKTIARKMQEADIIYFDGGYVPQLSRIFEKYHLADHLYEAQEKGVTVGGICAGGIMMGRLTAYRESDLVHQVKGAGLIPQAALSTYTTRDKEDKEIRCSFLRRAVEGSFCAQAVAIGSDQLVVYDVGQESFAAYIPQDNAEDQDGCFFVHADGTSSPIAALR